MIQKIIIVMLGFSNEEGQGIPKISYIQEEFFEIITSRRLHNKRDRFHVYTATS